MADANIYQQGAEHSANGRVSALEAQPDGIRAQVRDGDTRHEVTLSNDDGLLQYQCDCEVGRQSLFCAHAVAVALAWFECGTPAKKKKPARAKPITLAEAAKALSDLDGETWHGLVFEWAREDKILKERLLLYAARQSGPEASVALAKQSFQQAVRVRGFLHRGQVRSWARAVNQAIDAFVQVQADGGAAELIELCEDALMSLEKAVQRMDDSDGYFSVLAARLHSLHHAACLETRPEPVALATRLFRLEIGSEFDLFHQAADRYAPILGERGLAAYRKLAEAEWAKVPAPSSASEYDWSSFRITSIMEALERGCRDTDALVRILSRDLSSSYRYLRVAACYEEAGRLDEAATWAERGLAAFPSRLDGRLVEFLADLYLKQGRGEPALQLIWDALEPFALPGQYQVLERVARERGEWPAWRERALEAIREEIARGRAETVTNKAGWQPEPPDHSLLVEIFVYENRLEEAWQEARTGGCSSQCWYTLAEASHTTQPGEAGEVYLRLARQELVESRTSRYHSEVALLIKAAGAMHRANRGQEFQRELERLKLDFRLKRTFLALLEENRSRLYL